MCEHAYVGIVKIGGKFIMLDILKRCPEGMYRLIQTCAQHSKIENSLTDHVLRVL